MNEEIDLLQSFLQLNKDIISPTKCHSTLLSFGMLVTRPRMITTLLLSLPALALAANTARLNGHADYALINGKDRTGWAAAALLTLLGVPRDVVTADYLRSNDYLLPAYRKEIDGFVKAGGEH